MKICPICGVPKEEDQFYIKKRKRKNGTVYEYRDSQCKSCVEKAKYQRRKANPETHERRKATARIRSRKSQKEKPHLAKERGKKFTQRHIEGGTFKTKWLWDKYKITLEEFNNMRAGQDYRCKICKKSEEELGYVLHVDHCHKEGKIRGLLCSKCNMALGGFEDSIESLRRAVEYLF